MKPTRLSTILLGSAGIVFSLALALSAAPALLSIAEENYLRQGMYNLALDKAHEIVTSSIAGNLAISAMVVSLFAGGLFVLLRVHPNRSWPGLLLSRIPFRTGVALGIFSITLFSLLVAYVDNRKKPKSPNIVLIVIDTLRADHLGCYGHDKDVSPVIDKFAAGSYLFEAAYSSSSWTRPSVASILTSRTPLDHGITSESRDHILGPNFLTIQEFMRNRNYETVGILTNPHYKFGVDQNFDEVTYHPNGWAKDVYNHAIEFLETRGDEPFFLLIHSNDPHDEYEYHPDFSTTPKDSAFRRLNDYFPIVVDEDRIKFEDQQNEVVRLMAPELAEMKENYDGEIRYLDHHIGRFLDRLKENGKLDNTIVVITADHGEEFLDHGGYWHGGTLYNELLRVPLIVYLPGKSGGRIEQPVMPLDIFPTLIELLDQDFDGTKLAGSSLLGPIRGEPRDPKPIISATQFRGRLKHSLLDGDYKLIRYADGEMIGLFDVRKDPSEQSDLSSDARFAGERVRMEEILERTLTASKDVATQARPPAIEVTEEMKKELRELGYIDN